ncbi:MAG: flagellar basal-body MS-ring/collar protein FliF [Bryobacteraceae bacterium]
MDQLKKLLERLSLRQKIFLVAAAIAVIGGLAAFSRWRHEQDLRPLFTGLAAEDAGAVVQKLRETGVEYKLSDTGGAILVPSARVAELRLQLASAGLPKSGRVGFELFDKTNFGVTDFAEQINYRRAIEGELERTVMALNEVEAARVHVTFPKDSVFLESRQPAKASVMLKLKPGAQLSGANVVAVCHLVASAVEGLAPESVSIIDMNGNLLNRARKAAGADGSQNSEASLDYRRQVEKDLVAKIDSTLEPLLGADKFRAGVSVECDFSGGEQSEESFDPTRSVMASSQKTEDVSGTNLASGVPGTASALPRPSSRPGTGNTGMTRRTESIAYQTSRLVKRVRLPEGGIKRMSVAVLVDQNVRWEGSGAKMKRIIEPPPPEKLKAIHELVAAATGFSQDRGDQLIVETLPFEATLTLEPPQAPVAPASPAPPLGLPAWATKLDRNTLLIGAGAALALIALLAGAILLGRGKKRVGVSYGGAAEIEAGPSVLEQAEAQLQAKFAEQEEMKHRLEAEALSALKVPVATTKKTEVLSKHIVETAKKDPTSMAQILRTWLYDMEK